MNTMHRMKPRLRVANRFNVALAISACLLVGLQCIYANGFELDGVIESEFFSVDERPTYSTTKRFRMRVDGTRYLLRMEKPGEDMETDFVEVAYDGRATYLISTMPSWVESRRQSGEDVGENIASATVKSGRVPQFTMAGDSGPLWSTYVLSNLKHESPKSEDITLLPFMVGTSRRAVDSSNRELRRADTVDFIKAANESAGTEKVVWRSHGGGGPCTNAFLQVLQWTNVAGRLLPKQVVAESYSCDSQGESLRARYAISVESAGRLKGRGARFSPEIPGLTVVMEQRFDGKIAPGFMFMYDLSEGDDWPTKRAVKKFPQYQQAAAVLGLSDDSRKPLYIVLLIIVVAMGPILFMVYRRRAR